MIVSPLMKKNHRIDCGKGLITSMRVGHHSSDTSPTRFQTLSNLLLQRVVTHGQVHYLTAVRLLADPQSSECLVTRISQRIKDYGPTGQSLEKRKRERKSGFVWSFLYLRRNRELGLSWFSLSQHFFAFNGDCLLLLNP